MGDPCLSRRPVQPMNCSGVRMMLRLGNLTHKLASLFIVHDIDVLIEFNEVTVIAGLACRPEEVERSFDIELAST